MIYMAKQHITTELELNDEGEFTSSSDQLHISEPIQQEIEYLLSKFKKNKIILQPEFQREFVWSKKKQKELIKSVWKNIPLPMFYFSVDDKETFEVIDGQQRLTTLFGYLSPQSVDAHIKKKLIKNLKIKDSKNNKIENNEIIKKIKRTNIYCVKIPENHLNSNKKFEIFTMLNQGAMTLKPQEIRNAIFQQDMPYLNKSLKKLAKKLSNLTKIKYSRMAGQELVLRFFVINEWGYEKKVSDNLINIDRLKNVFGEKRCIQLSKEFTIFLKRMKKTFPNHYFETLKSEQRQPKNASNWKMHIFTNKPNQALFHLFSFYLPKYKNYQFNKHSPYGIRNGFMKLLKNKKFVSNISGSGTDSTKRIIRSKKIFEKEFAYRYIGDYTKTINRNISNDEKRTLYDNLPYCYLCYGKIRKLKDAYAEHITPFKSTGISKLKNILLSHKKCNERKGIKPLEKYRDENVLKRYGNKNKIPQYQKALSEWNKNHPLTDYKKLVGYAKLDYKLG
jgi:hypothetical protein